MRPPLVRLELRNVSKTYGDGNQPVEVLHDISLTAEAGSITALVGRSGCGKTTLLNLVGAMDFPTSGEVLIDGRSTGSLDDRELTALRRTRVGRPCSRASRATGRKGPDPGGATIARHRSRRYRPSGWRRGGRPSGNDIGTRAAGAGGART